MKKFIILVITLLFCCANYSYAINTEKQSRTTDYMNINFWQKFNDENLVNNLYEVYQNNNDLKAAVLKVNEAQRVVKMSFADELPHVGFQGYVGEIFNSSDQVFGDIRIPDYTEAHYLLPLNMNYEIDIWGKNHLKTKSKKKQLEMIEQDERAAYIYISSVFASDYYNLIRVDKLIEYQNKLIAVQKQIVEIMEKKYEYGTATQNDVDEAQKGLTYLEEELQKFLEKQDILKNQMSTILADRSFGDIKRPDFDELQVSFAVPENIAFNILDNRPDRIKSELDLERIGIDVKVAKRELLPSFIISGNVGFNMYSISSPHNFLADIGVIPVWDLFMGGKKIQMLKLKKDTYNIAVEHYEKTVLKSIQESNDALYSLKTTDRINAISNRRLDTDKKLLSDTVTKEEAGIAENLDILLRKEKLIEAQKSVVMSETNKIVSYINLYQALGGYDISNGII